MASTVNPATASSRRKPTRWPKEVRDRVRRLHAAGLTDREIRHCLADVFAPGPEGRWQVINLRRRLGLAAKPGGGTDTPSGRTQALAKWGLPADLTPFQQLLLLALTAGPMTARAAYEACGVPASRPDAPNKTAVRRRRRNGQQVSVLQDLCDLGLVVQVATGDGPTARMLRGRDDVYLLTPACLDMIQLAVERQTAGAT